MELQVVNRAYVETLAFAEGLEGEIKSTWDASASFLRERLLVLLESDEKEVKFGDS